MTTKDVSDLSKLLVGTIQRSLDIGRDMSLPSLAKSTPVTASECAITETFSQAEWGARHRQTARTPVRHQN